VSRTEGVVLRKYLPFWSGLVKKRRNYEGFFVHSTRRMSGLVDGPRRPLRLHPIGNSSQVQNVAKEEIEDGNEVEAARRFLEENEGCRLCASCSSGGELRLVNAQNWEKSICVTLDWDEGAPELMQVLEGRLCGERGKDVVWFDKSQWDAFCKSNSKPISETADVISLVRTLFGSRMSDPDAEEVLRFLLNGDELESSEGLDLGTRCAVFASRIFEGLSKMATPRTEEEDIMVEVARHSSSPSSSSNAEPPVAVERIENHDDDVAAVSQTLQLGVEGEMCEPFIVDTVARAERLMDELKALPPSTIYGCDTEAEIDLQKQNPVGNGMVTCVTLYAGKEMRFGGEGSSVFVDVLGKPEILERIKPFLESEKTLKVWHNYSFDRHILFNHGVDVMGLKGDTMHLGRLEDSSRDKTLGKGGYSLEALSEAFLGQKSSKTSLKQLFRSPKLNVKGEKLKTFYLPPVSEIQESDRRLDWIQYSCFDAMCTKHLYVALANRLREMEWRFTYDYTSTAQSRMNSNMLEMYEQCLLPFAVCLTDIEREGFQLDIDHLKNAEMLAQKSIKELSQAFNEWLITSGALKDPSDVQHINAHSTLQKNFIFFAENGVLQLDPKLQQDARRKELKRRAADSTSPKKDFNEGMFQKAEFEIKLDEPCPDSGKTKKRKHIVGINGLGLTAKSYTKKSGLAQTGNAEMAALAGKPNDDPPTFGPAFDQLVKKHKKMKIQNEEAEARAAAACKAIDHLNSITAIEKLLSTFIKPLMERADTNNRIHCSLNLGTETGRLSSSGPNLQNQPSLEKDVYKIRKAFTCRPGNMLIVADYGQLELRVLAHLAKCESMIEAFKAGGDFHSRTALSMYDYIQKKLNAGEVLLEWDSAANGGQSPPVPLIKDEFATERKRAKILNFSIAYGKTSMGLSQDFGVSKTEAQQIVDKWYAARPEIREWQEKQKENARIKGWVETLWGRRRKFSLDTLKDRRQRGVIERAAINTPVQGSAADIVMAAMNRVHANKRLLEIGWKMILQVHDEIIMEGPEESTEEAQNILMACMEDPLEYELLVALEVDSKAAKTWYEGK